MKFSFHSLRRALWIWKAIYSPRRYRSHPCCQSLSLPCLSRFGDPFRSKCSKKCFWPTRRSNITWNVSSTDGCRSYIHFSSIWPNNSVKTKHKKTGDRKTQTSVGRQLDFSQLWPKCRSKFGNDHIWPSKLFQLSVKLYKNAFYWPTWWSKLTKKL